MLRRLHGSRGFSLTEVMFAMAVLSIIFTSSISLIHVHRLQSRKAMEQSIMLDFAQHYLELARNQPFNEIRLNRPINDLYDSSKQSPLIRIPPNDKWWSLWTTDYRVFHPDLEWFEGRDPQIRCTVTRQVVDGEDRARTINFEVRWRPPINLADRWITLQLNTTAYPDFH